MNKDHIDIRNMLDTVLGIASAGTRDHIKVCGECAGGLYVFLETVREAVRSGRPPGRCRDFDEVLMAEYHDGVLPGKEKGRYERHLAGCPYCLTFYLELKSDLKKVRKSLFPLVPRMRVPGISVRLFADSLDLFRAPRFLTPSFSYAAAVRGRNSPGRGKVTRISIPLITPDFTGKLELSPGTKDELSLRLSSGKVRKNRHSVMLIRRHSVVEERTGGFPFRFRVRRGGKNPCRIEIDGRKIVSLKII